MTYVSGPKLTVMTPAYGIISSCKEARTIIRLHEQLVLNAYRELDINILACVLELLELAQESLEILVGQLVVLRLGDVGGGNADRGGFGLLGLAIPVGKDGDVARRGRGDGTQADRRESHGPDGNAGNTAGMRATAGRTRKLGEVCWSHHFGGGLAGSRDGYRLIDMVREQSIEAAINCIRSSAK